jgi:hypothetical protein
MKNCCTDTGPAPRQVSTDELARNLQAKSVGTDSARATQLGGLQTMRQTKSAMLAREQTRLSTTLGAQNPRVLALQQKIAVNQNLAVQLDRTQARSQTSVFEPDPNAWIVQGHVRTADSKPVPQATVALYTCAGQWVRQFGYACTDANGYFKLTVRPSTGNTLSTGVASNNVDVTQAAPPNVSIANTDQPSATVAVPPPSVGTTQPSSTAPQPEVTSVALDTVSAVNTSTTAVKLCLNATDANQRFLGGSNGTLTPRLGGVDYREIIVDSTAACTPPPGDATGAAPGCGPATQGGPGTTQGGTGTTQGGTGTTQGAPGSTVATRFLGNSNKHEVHDLQNAKKQCAIDRIAAKHRVYFNSPQDAVKAGYDYCAYCFGKAASKR